MPIRVEDLNIDDPIDKKSSIRILGKNEQLFYLLLSRLESMTL